MGQKEELSVFGAPGMLGLNKNFDESQPHQMQIGGAQVSWAGQAQGGPPIGGAFVM